jgi:hypothetical protein
MALLRHYFRQLDDGDTAPGIHPPYVCYAINAAIDVLQASNVDDGAFVLIHVSVLSGGCRSSGARQSLDIPSKCANDLRIAAALYGAGRSCRRERREQYIRVGQVAEEWSVLFPNYFLKNCTTTAVRCSGNTQLHLAFRLG